MKHHFWFSRIVPNRPMERVSVYMFLMSMSGIVCMSLQVHLWQKSVHYWMLCKYLILSNSLSSIEALRSQRISVRTHSIIYECEEVLLWLRSRQFGVPGNDMVDGIAKYGAKTELYYPSNALRCNFYPQIKSRLLFE
jgi:hypothetical protein